VSFLGNGGRLYWEFVFWMWASNCARWRTKNERRRNRSRVSRLSLGYTWAIGKNPPLRSPAIFCASSRSFLALPPWIAFMASA
jgi:hypothetical protein